MSDETNSAPVNVSPGDKIAGYRLEEQIGQGGMAVVYRAHDERLDRRVALKLLAPGLAADTAFRTRFIRESRAAAAVDHPNIIPVYDAGDAGGFLFISMRYVSGGDVRSLFASGKMLSPARVWNIISQVAAALDAAHEHDLIHRDVKPANMLLDAGGGRNTGGKRNQLGDENDHVYLSDFGISKQTLASHLTSTGQFVGTLDYIAPEQIEGKESEGKADQYALACTTYELMTGEPPYQRDLGLALINAHLSQPAPSIIAKRPELSPSVDQVLAKAMAKAPANRYATCTEFATDLGKAIGMVAGTPSVAAATAAPPAGPGGQPVVHPATQLVAGPVTSPDAPAPNQAIPPAVAAAGGIGAVGAAAAVGAAGPGQPPVTGQPQFQNMATEYAGQTPPPQQMPQGQTPPPQQMPPTQGWQGSGQVGYPQYPQGQQQQGQQQQGQQQQGQYPQGQYPQGQQQQPYQTGPIPPYQTGPIGQPVTGYPQQYAGQQIGPTAQGVWPSQQPPQQPPKRSRGVLIGAVAATVAVAVAVVAVVYFVALKKNTATPSPTVTITSSGSGNSSSSSAPNNNSSSSNQSQDSGTTAQTQATSISNLLMSSANSRSQWDATTLVNNTGNCVNIDQDVTQIGDIANSRSSELSQVQTLQFDKLPNGASLKSQLMTALQVSLQIDNDYLKWAQQQQSSGCAYGFNNTYYNNASAEDNTATNDKQNFLDSWDPVASQYNLEQFSAGQI
ncbi:MAG TPA: serine/threonine-protein kinase [Streptosporangiaceae bacterium]